MSKAENPPLERGETDTNIGDYVGFEYDFIDLDYSSRPNRRRTGITVTVRVVKNSSGIALLPKLAVQFKDTTNRTEIIGYSSVLAGNVAGIVDEFIPAAGVADGDYFYLVTRGPCMGTVSTGAASNAAVINEQDGLVALTAAASTFSTTAGRPIVQAPVGGSQNAATALIDAQMVQNAFAVALSATTTADTDSDVLLHLNCRWDA